MIYSIQSVFYQPLPIQTQSHYYGFVQEVLGIAGFSHDVIGTLIGRLRQHARDQSLTVDGNVFTVDEKLYDLRTDNFGKTYYRVLS